MNQSDIRFLQSIREYPSLSILTPTHRTSPANRQDPIRVKNLVKEATDRLTAEFPRRDVEPLLTRLEQEAARIDFPYTLEGLALFVNRTMARTFYLPFTVKERVAVDDTFATRDLVFTLNRSPRYWVLALSEQPTRLYEGLRDNVNEVTLGGFPMTHEGPGGATALPGGFGVQRSAYRDEAHRRFFRAVDAALGRVLAVEPLPLAVLGVERYLAFFDEVSQNKQQVITTLRGSYDKTSAPELAEMVWPAVRSALVASRRAALEDLEAAVGEQRYAAGINEVWPLANEGRGATLLVEEDYHYPARHDPTGLYLIPAVDPTAPEVLDDAVDDMIEVVLAKGGRVVFEDPGVLTAYQHIAMILRY
jgi:hypothetical protein